MSLFMSGSVLVRMPNLPLDGPSEQLLAEETHSTQVVVWLLAWRLPKALMENELGEFLVAHLMAWGFLFRAAATSAERNASVSNLC